MTLAASVAPSSVERALVVEINPNVPKAARFFAKHNDHVTADQRIKIMREDARTYIRYTHERFDVITSDPIHPWTRGSSSLFTLEHFRNTRAVLRDGGVMAQWVPLYELSVEDYFRIINTFCQAFPHVALINTGHDTVLLGAGIPFGPQITGLEGVVAVDGALRQAVAEAGINDDDHLQLEYSAPRFMNHSARSEILATLRRIQPSGTSLANPPK
jgi:spermidine synthase